MTIPTQEEAFQEHHRNCDEQGYHVDGCWYCGADHPSGCCTDRGEEDADA